MNLLVVALLVAAPDHIDPQIKLPSVAAFNDAPTSAAVLTVNLTKHGEIRVDPAQVAIGDRVVLSVLKKEGLTAGIRTITLEELGDHLSEAKRMYHLIQKAKGKSGYDTVAPGIERCGLHVDLHADRDAPWAHVRLLFAYCAEELYYKVRIAALRPDGTTGLLDARLPTLARSNKPVRFQPIRVSLLATKEKEAQWGPAGSTAKVALATDVTCRYGDRSFSWQSSWNKPAGRADIDAWLRATRKQRDPKEALVGQIFASQKTTVAHFASILSLFRSARYKHVHFYVTAIAPPQLRKLRGLPYPPRNALPRSVRGDPPRAPDDG